MTTLTKAHINILCKHNRSVFVKFQFAEQTQGPLSEPDTQYKHPTYVRNHRSDELFYEARTRKRVRFLNIGQL